MQELCAEQDKSIVKKDWKDGRGDEGEGAWLQRRRREIWKNDIALQQAQQQAAGVVTHSPSQQQRLLESRGCRQVKVDE